MSTNNVQKPIPPNLVDCSRVYVNNDSFGGVAAFALCPIKKGELVESDVVPNTTWVLGSGCATFYNSTTKEKANTHMYRFFDEDRFEIYATRDIMAGEELLHVYKSKKWRRCFRDLL